MKLFHNALKSLKTLQNMSFYAVARGHKVGIYDTWPQCESQVKNFKGAKYKKFPTLAEAENFIKTNSAGTVPNSTQFAPQYFALPLGKKGPVVWKAQEKSMPTTTSTALPLVEEFWPECDGDVFDAHNDISDADLLAAVSAAEGVSADTTATSSRKRKAKCTSTIAIASEPKYKQLKHESKVWEPMGLKKIGRYEFYIDCNDFVIVYTDGSCFNNGRSNPVAGFGVYFADDHPLNVGLPVHGRVTNNAGEIQAAIHAIRVAKEVGVERLCISTDSQFLINSTTSWMSAWKSKNWRLKSGEPVKNADDFKRLDKLLMDDSVDVKWNYVKAHKGIRGNEMADRLARQGSELYKIKFLVK